MIRELHQRRKIVHGPEDQHLEGVPGLQMFGWSVFASANANGLRAHVHEGHYELVHVVKGEVEFWVEDELFSLRPGDLFLTLPDESHGGHGHRMDACEIQWVIFSLDGEAGDFGLSNTECQHMRASLDLGRGRVQRAAPETGATFSHLLRCLEANGPLLAAEFRAGMVLLLSSVCEVYGASSVPQRMDARIPDHLRWMADHCHENPSLEVMAQQLSLKTSFYRELFTRETGYRPLEYLTRLKVRRAKQFLLEGERSITEIGFALGFSSSQYFSSTFRRMVGMSPRQFRVQARAVETAFDS